MVLLTNIKRLAPATVTKKFVLDVLVPEVRDNFAGTLFPA